MTRAHFTRPIPFLIAILASICFHTHLQAGPPVIWKKFLNQAREIRAARKALGEGVYIRDRLANNNWRRAMGTEWQSARNAQTALKEMREAGIPTRYLLGQSAAGHNIWLHPVHQFEEISALIAEGAPSGQGYLTFYASNPGEGPSIVTKFLASGMRGTAYEGVGGELRSFLAKGTPHFAQGGYFVQRNAAAVERMLTHFQITGVLDPTFVPTYDAIARGGRMFQMTGLAEYDVPAMIRSDNEASIPYLLVQDMTHADYTFPSQYNVTDAVIDMERARQIFR